METVILIILAGLAWGSFLNVVIYRIPRRLSLIRPRSSCPACREPIRPVDNIPLLSFLILRGKCRRCGARIPLSYPLAEILTPAAFLILHHHYGLSAYFFVSCLFASGLIALAFIDYQHKILPDEIVYPGIVLGLIYALVRPDMTILQALIGAAVGAGFLLIVYGAYYLVRKKEGLGLGDVTMMLMVGAYLGWLKTLLTLILASFGGVIAGIYVIAVKKKGMQAELPYGTFLAPAAFISLIWGEAIVAAYLSLFQ